MMVASHTQLLLMLYASTDGAFLLYRYLCWVLMQAGIAG